MNPQLLTTLGTILGIALLFIWQNYKDGKSLFRRTKQDGYDENLFNAIMYKLEHNHFDHLPSKNDFQAFTKEFQDFRKEMSTHNAMEIEILRDIKERHEG